MILARFDTEALTRVRFAISPMLETIRSVTALDDPAACSLHLPWARATEFRTEDLDLTVLRALQSSGAYNPDFVNPPPSTPLAKIEDEIAVMLATPSAQIREEVATAYAGRRLPAELRRFEKEPRLAIRDVADVMRAYWDLALAEHWPRIRALLEHDVLYRSRQIADGGTRSLFADLHPSVRWSDGELTVECGDTEETALELDERGLLLVPSVFVWPKVTFVTAPPWQPTLIYPARGVGMLWSDEQVRAPGALAKLVGQTRAALLTALDSPRSTTELAVLLDMTSGGVSQHLTILREAGLVRGNRVQRMVLYMRSAEGEALVRASDPGPDPTVAGAA